MKRTALFLMPCLVLSIMLFFPLNALTQNAPPETIKQSHLLDGKTFTGQNGSKGKPADRDDDFIFSDGMFRSTSCDDYGFASAPYEAKKIDGVIYFKSVTKSPSHGQIAWEGQVDGDKIDGTFVWTKERWYWDIRKEYWLKGKLEK